jgi:hypothetical protein
MAGLKVTFDGFDKLKPDAADSPDDLAGLADRIKAAGDLADALGGEPGTLGHDEYIAGRIRPAKDAT